MSDGAGPKRLDGELIRSFDDQDTASLVKLQSKTIKVAVLSIAGNESPTFGVVQTTKDSA